jgi:hypothetical protein
MLNRVDYLQMTRFGAGFRVLIGRSAPVLVSLIAVGTAASLLVADAAAQAIPTRLEITGGLSGLDFFNEMAPTLYRSSVGVIGALDFRATRRVAVEVRIAWFPRPETALFQTQGGQTLELGAGFRADMLHVGRLTGSFTMLPGLVRFSATHTSILSSAGATSATYPTLQFIGSLTFDVSSRVFLRADAGFRFQPFESNVQPFEDNGILYTFGAAGVASAWRVDWGGGYRFGPPLDISARPLQTTGWTAGPTFTYSVVPSAYGLPALERSSGIGGFVSRRLTNWMDVEAGMQFFPRAIAPTAFDGGHLIKGAVDLRAGERGHRIGVFARGGPGFSSYSQVMRTADDTGPGYPIFTFSRGT